MPCLTFTTAKYYLPRRPLNGSSTDIVSDVTSNKTQELSSYSIFFCKCIGIFLLLNGSHYITKYVEDSDPTYYNNHYIDDIRSFQSFVAWGLFTALWNIILSHNINISNNKQKYQKIINETPDSNIAYKIRDIKYSHCNIYKTWHICIIVFLHDFIASMFLHFISLPLLFFDENSAFCQKLFKCSTFCINDAVGDGFAFCYVFLASSLTLMLFDIMLCRRLKRNHLEPAEDSLSTPLVSAHSTPGNSEIDMISMSYYHVEEIIHIQRASLNRSDSPVVWSTIPSTKPSMTTPIPSSFKNISYLGDSNTINDSCVNIWCLNILLTLMFLLYFIGIQFVAHWQNKLIETHFEKWTLGLLIYTSIWRYFMTRMGRMYDRLRIFSRSDRNSELNTMIKTTEKHLQKESNCSGHEQYFISIELILYVFVMSVYYITLRIYLVYYEPSGLSFTIALLFHIGWELFDNGVRTSVFYWNLTNNIWFLLAHIHKDDVCMGRIVGLLRDESELQLWRERFYVDISIKIVISFLSCLAAFLLNICEYLGYLTINNASFTSYQCAMSALRVSISVIAELILYVTIYYLRYTGKGFLFEPFTRIISRISDKHKFVWMFMASFIVAGLTYAGKNI